MNATSIVPETKITWWPVSERPNLINGDLWLFLPHVENSDAPGGKGLVIVGRFDPGAGRLALWLDSSDMALRGEWEPSHWAHMVNVPDPPAIAPMATFPEPMPLGQALRERLDRFELADEESDRHQKGHENADDEFGCDACTTTGEEYGRARESLSNFLWYNRQVITDTIAGISRKDEPMTNENEKNKPGSESDSERQRQRTPAGGAEDQGGRTGSTPTSGQEKPSSGGGTESSEPGSRPGTGSE